MSNAPQFLFQVDPERFLQIVTNDDWDQRLSLVPTVDDHLLCEVIRYGMFNKTEMIDPLANLYRQLTTRLPVDARSRVYRHVIGFVENTSFVSTNAFLPFIVEERDRGIVSTAVIDYVSLGPLTDGDPMSRVKDVIGMIERGMLANEGAAFGALLHIGDRRVCKLLVPLRDTFDRDAMNEIVGCATGLVHSATVDFYLDWLEGLEGDYTDGKFGTVASGLGLLKRKSLTDTVATGDRPFPTRGATPDDWESLNLIPIEEYLRRISRRMYALERSEPAPKVMPIILAAWGLTPLTDPAEAAVLDDRTASAKAYGGNEPIPGDRIADITGEWWEGEGNIFLLWGILNPDGPTLYVLGSRELDGRHRTFFRWLHMFGGITTYAAEAFSEVTYRGIYEDALSIDEHLTNCGEPGLFHVVPSFLIAIGGDEVLADIAKRLLGTGGASKGDWGRPMAYTRQFGSDFFGRVGAEIRETCESELAEAKARGDESSALLEYFELRYGDLPEFRDAKLPAWKRTSMTRQLLDEWWSIVSPGEFKVAALAALKEMWEGASTMQTEATGANPIPWERVMGFLKAYGLGLSN